MPWMTFFIHCKSLGQRYKLTIKHSSCEENICDIVIQEYDISMLYLYILPVNKAVGPKCSSHRM